MQLLLPWIPLPSRDGGGETGSVPIELGTFVIQPSGETHQDFDVSALLPTVVRCKVTVK